MFTWHRNCLGTIGVILVFSALVACGDDAVELELNQENDETENDETIDPNQDNHNDETASGHCQENDDCVGDTYCHDEVCVSRQFICSLQGCAGSRGVCNPEAGVDGDCLNAEVCAAENDCLEGYMCIEGSCLPEEEACEECWDQGDECIFDHNTLSVDCHDPFEVCEPGVRECEGDILHVCNNLGTSQQSYQCNRGCDPETLTCEVPAGANCANPIRAEHDQIFEFSWSEFSNDYDPEPATGCVDENTNLRTRGSDLTFALEVEPGQTGVVELITHVDYAVLYVLESCESGASSCQQPDGELNDWVFDDFVRALWFYNDTAETQTYYVVADSGLGAAGQTASVKFGITEQVCEPGEQVCSDSFLGECNAYGTGYHTDPSLPCTLGCYDTTDPTVDQCAVHENSYCANATLYEGHDLETYVANIIDYDGDTSLSAYECDEQSIGGGLTSTFEGPTAYYEVDLLAEHRLNANLASSFEAGLWITTGCESEQCRMASNTSASTEFLSYVAQEDETVQLVVQAAHQDVQIGEFALDLSIDPPLCTGLQDGDILGCVDETVISYCTGTPYASHYGCDGGCDSDQCVEPSGNHCLETIPLDLIDSYSGSFAELSNYLAPSSCEGDQSFETPAGPEAIFELEIPDNQLVQVDLQSNSASAGFYLLDSCPVSTPQADEHCVFGALPSDQTDFFIDEGGTYYLVVDSSNQNDNASFTVDIHISEGVCLPGARRCTAHILEQCDEHGDAYEQIATCLVDCDDDALTCTAPDEVNDRCNLNPYFVGESGRIVDDFSRFNQREQLFPGECFDQGTDGPDAFYEFELGQMQGITLTARADVTDSGSHEVGLYLVGDECPLDPGVDPNEACIRTLTFDGDGTDEATLDYYTAEAGNYKVGLAALTGFSSGQFTIDFEFFDGECDPETDDFCVDPDTAQRCTDKGQIETFDCFYGCEAGYCLPKEGNSCERPFDIDEQATVDGDGNLLFSHIHSLSGTGYTDEFNPADTGDSCTGGPGDGPDVVYTFEGWKGDELTVEFSTEYDGTVWITNDCANAAAQCLAGEDSVWGAGTEVLEYTIPQQNTYFIIADAVQTGATGDFSVDVTVEPGPRVDDPELLVDGEENLKWELYVQESDSAQFQIGNGGEYPLEFEVSSTESWIDFAPVDGTVASGDWHTVEASVTCPDNPATYVAAVEITTNDMDNETYTLVAELLCEQP